MRLLLISFVFILSGCTGGKDQTNIELLQDMMEQPNIKSQEDNLLPPENTTPRGFKRYSSANLGKDLKNPIYNIRLADVIIQGKKNYDLYCAICHGNQGRGDGNIASKLIQAPTSLLIKKVRDYKDGEIFHIITKGYGQMGAYVDQIPKEKDRWAVVNYIRNLQRLNKE